MKHTPGPWKVTEDGSLIHNNHVFCIEGANSELLVYGQVTKADAHLMAAAPDLLEAAKAVMLHFTSTNGVPVDKATISAKSQEVVALAAAIVKAGEQA
jgi:hypothetical protein